MKRWTNLLMIASLLLVLGLVFALYGRPDFMMTLANQIWGCF